MIVRWFLALVVLLSAASGVQGDPVQVPTTADLQAVGQLAEQRGLPLLLVFTASHCSYCELLESAILRPMLISGDYDDRVIIRKIELDGVAVRDFQGKIVDAGDYATRRDVFVTPTMLFVDGDGVELAERLIGINTVEMFSGLVEAALEEASETLAARRQGAGPLARAQPTR